jgi:hypothetical protein
MDNAATISNAVTMGRLTPDKDENGKNNLPGGPATKLDNNNNNNNNNNNIAIAIEHYHFRKRETNNNTRIMSVIKEIMKIPPNKQKFMLLSFQMLPFSQPFIFLVNSVSCSVSRLFVDLYALNLIIFHIQLKSHPWFRILYQFERYIEFVLGIVVVTIRVNYCETSFNAV